MLTNDALLRIWRSGLALAQEVTGDFHRVALMGRLNRRGCNPNFE